MSPRDHVRAAQYRKGKPTPPEKNYGVDRLLKNEKGDRVVSPGGSGSISR